MSNFCEGQVWVCDASGSVPPLMCVVGRLDHFSENDEASRILSVFVLPHPDAKEAGWPTVSHIPIFEDAFEASAVRLVHEGQPLGPDFEEGYAQWRSSFDDGRADAFSLNISRAYEIVVSAWDEGNPNQA